MARRVSLNPNFGDILMNLAADTNGLESAASLLGGGRRAVESNISGSDWSSARSRASSPITVEDEVGSLFSRQSQLKCGSDPFVKDLVLIPDPRIELVPRQGVKLKLIQDGFYNQGVHFQKEWSYDHILQKIRDIFRDKLPDSCSLELLHSVHQRLLPPSMDAGQQTKEYFITKICKDTPLYVKIYVDLLSDENELGFNNNRVVHSLFGKDVPVLSNARTCYAPTASKIAAASNEEDFKAAVFKAMELMNLAGCTSLTLKFTPEGQIPLVKSPNKVCEGQGEMSLTLKDRLVFTTGADEVPPLGFTFPLQLSFIHQEDLRDEAQYCTAGFPYTTTCSMELKIPVLNDYNTFQRNMAVAIYMAATFTNQ